MVVMPKQNVPALRLEGFSGEWELKAIGELFAERNKSFPEGELLSVTLRNGIKRFQEIGRHNTSNEDKSKYKLVEVGDIAYNSMRMWQGASGVSPWKGIVSPAYTVLKPVGSQDTPFFAYYFKTPFMIQVFQLNSQGLTSDTWNLKYPALSAIDICRPQDIEEQQAIGAIFTNLDAAINQHTLKHKALQQAKTALMQRMFPQEGQTVPELRLKGFSGEWEETTLGELGSTYGGLSGKKKEDFGHGDAMYVTYKDIFSRALITDTSQCERVEVDASQNEVRYGDIFFTTSSEIPEEVGLSAVWLIDKPNVYLNSFCFGFRPTGGFDLHFLGHVLRSPAVRSQFLLLAQGISRFNISKTKAANISLYAPPTLEEQQAIGAMFTNLDQLIAAEAQYIASLKQAKTALLQRMFI